MRLKYSAFLICAATSAIAATALAHISLEMGGGPLTSRSGDGNNELKDAPCGVAGSMRGTTVFTFEPGQTITLQVNEYIFHPGYFRIAFDDDGDDGFEEPQSIMPMNRQCMANETRCGQTDFCNNETVLYDNLDAHWPPGDTPAQPATLPTYEWQVKLPDVECERCTLQILQIMTDPAMGFHGPYDLNADIYHQCVDIVLRRGTGGAAGQGGTAVMNNGIDCRASAGSGAAGAGAGAGGAGGAGGGAAGGANGSATSGGTAGVGALPMAGAPASGSSGTAGSSVPPVMPAPATTGTQPASGAMAGAAAIAPASPPAKSGGCNVAAGGSQTLGSLAWAGLALLAITRRRRIR